ncbi:hypothetical protein [Helicobacter felis]|uniref:hypothetical protein n=1 Tax=Helicobacter felis TaxID=214 RepID=UPI001F35604B|nr:hypothetical protein [Helicobacter felis]
MKETKQHFEHYKEMCKIDYCAYFIKNYLAFNFHCKTRFKDKKKDRDIIDALKDDKKVLNRFLEHLGEKPQFFVMLKYLDKTLTHRE